MCCASTGYTIAVDYIEVTAAIMHNSKTTIAYTCCQISLCRVKT